MRSGLFLKKIGMSQVFADTGEQIPVTLLRLDSCQVVSQKTNERDGYTSVQLGIGEAKVSRMSNAARGYFTKNNMEPKKTLKEMRVSEDHLLPIGEVLTVEHFNIGAFVDVSALGIGKGFAGPMKRWNFGGGPASHGASLCHRAHGSTGGRKEPGRTFKNKKMAGQLGGKRITVQNLKIVMRDIENGILAIKGAVPGPKGAWVIVRDAVKKKAV
jgi:large subunit ribosomal protein L3